MSIKWTEVIVYKKFLLIESKFSCSFFAWRISNFILRLINLHTATNLPSLRSDGITWHMSISSGETCLLSSGKSLKIFNSVSSIGVPCDSVGGKPTISKLFTRSYWSIPLMWISCEFNWSSSLKISSFIFEELASIISLSLREVTFSGF